MRDKVTLLLACVLFLGLSAHQLTLPGFHYDEAFEVVPAMRMLQGERTATFRQNGISISGQVYPLMTQDYIGAINTYAALPFLLVLGFNVSSVRVLSVVIGVGGLVLCAVLAGRIVGGIGSRVAVLLLAVSPSFVFWNRQGVFVTSVTTTIGLAAALSWHAWWRTSRRPWALLGAFLLGFGLYAKFLFLWMIAAFGFTLAVVTLANHGWRLSEWAAWSRRLGQDHRVGWGLVFACGACFTLGTAPLVIYNIQTGGTFLSVTSNLTTSFYGTNNLAFLSNIWQRTQQLVMVVSGGHLWYLGATYNNWLAAALFVASCLAVPWSFSKGHATAAAPALVVLLVLLFSCATVSALWVTHFAMLVPWVYLTIGAGVNRLIAELEVRKGFLSARFVPAVLVAVTIAGAVEVFDCLRYHRVLARSGGLADHSDAIYDMAEWMEGAFPSQSGIPVAAMDWGLAANLVFLTRGGVQPVEAFGYDWETGDEFASRLKAVMDNPDSAYLWRAPDAIIFDRSQEFRSLYLSRGQQEDILAAFYDRSGKAVYGVTKLVPNGSAKNPPQPVD